VKTAGGDATRLFTRDAVIAIHQHSMGIPRVISVISDNALVNGFAADRKPVGASDVIEVCRTLSLTSGVPTRRTTPVAASTQAPCSPVSVIAASHFFNVIR